MQTTSTAKYKEGEVNNKRVIKAKIVQKENYLNNQNQKELPNFPKVIKLRTTRLKDFVLYFSIYLHIY